jgi:hypothetical protein
MKYMTRALYERYQPSYVEDNHLTPEEAKSTLNDWINAVQSYMKYFDSIKLQMPLGLQKVSHISFHDAIVKEVEWEGKDELILKLDGDGCPWGLRGQLTVIFKGVKNANIQSGFIGDYWLYEECHLTNIGKFDFQALLGHTEFSVIADDIELFLDGELYTPK